MSSSKRSFLLLGMRNITNRPVSFKEKYAVRILDSLPDMLTVFNQSEVGIEVVSNEGNQPCRNIKQGF